jgi:outer membrane protein assembly factor BamE (lipoprotein component of BamABCDE complex)
LRIQRHFAALSAAALIGVSIGACTPVTKLQGYTVLEENPAAAVVGTDTRQSVQTKYGTPTATSTFDPNVWYYMSQTSDQFGAYRVQVRQRNIVEIKFDPATQVVSEVELYDVNDGREIAYSDRETETIGRELGIIEQLLGTLGQTLLPQDDIEIGDTPGAP